MNKYLCLLILSLLEFCCIPQEKKDTVIWRDYSLLIDVSVLSHKVITMPLDEHGHGIIRQYFYIGEETKRDSIASSIVVYLGERNGLRLPDSIDSLIQKEPLMNNRKSIKIKKDDFNERYDILMDGKVILFYQFVHDVDLQTIDKILDNVTVFQKTGYSSLGCTSIKRISPK